MGSRWNRCFSTSQRNISCKFQKIHHLPAFLVFYFSDQIHNREFFICRIVGPWIFHPWETSTFFSTSGLCWGVYQGCIHASFWNFSVFFVPPWATKQALLVGYWLIYEGVCYLTKHGVTKAMIQVAISTHDSFFWGLSRCLRKTLPTSALLQKTPFVASKHFHHLNRSYLFIGMALRRHGTNIKLSTNQLRSCKFRWAMKTTWLFGVYRGWTTTQLYRDSFINHKPLFSDPVIHQPTRISYVFFSLFFFTFFRGSSRCRTSCWRTWPTSVSVPWDGGPLDGLLPMADPWHRMACWRTASWVSRPRSVSSRDGIGNGSHKRSHPGGWQGIT